MSDRSNVRRASGHYCPIGLLSCRVTVSWATIPRANVRSGCCLSGYCPAGLLFVGVVSSGRYPSVYCPVGLLSGNTHGYRW